MHGRVRHPRSVAARVARLSAGAPQRCVGRYPELLRLSSGNETVTAVAFRWGFNHLGHFTTDYKRRFGESPSATLARSPSIWRVAPW
ncbi:helix-turn-helix domain-containing protein [Pseudomonas veronii]